MVYRHDRLPPQQCNRPHEDGDAHKGHRHPRALRERQDVDLRRCAPALDEGLCDQRLDLLAVVPRRVFGQKAGAGRRDIGPAQVR